MAVKKLYTESWIADIADALRTVIGGTDTYNTREMAATLATIHRGAKDVWIGTQLAYNQLGTYDVEICYIIFDNNKVMRVYAGTTILYDDPVVWEYDLPTTVFSDKLIIDTELDPFTSANLDKPFEMIIHISNYVSGMYMIVGGDAFQARHTSTNNINFAVSPVTSWDSGHEVLNYKFRRDANNQIFVYDLDNDEELIHTFPPTVRESNNTIKLGGRDQWNASDFTLQEFKFRYIT